MFHWLLAVGVFSFLRLDTSCPVCHHIPLVYEWSAYWAHLESHLYFVTHTCLLVHFWRGECACACACGECRKRKKAELCFCARVCVCVWRNLPVRSRAGRGGACWVWDSRQRRRKHTDTGSPWRRGETAGGETRHTNSWTSFVFKSGRKKKQTFFFAMCLSAVWIHLWAERHVCVGAAAAAGNICRADDEVCGLVCLGMEKWGWHDRQLCA